MTTELDVDRCYPLAINKVGDKEVLTHDAVKNGKYTRTGGIAVEIKFKDNPIEGRILLFNICTSHTISIEKDGGKFRFNSEEQLNDCFDDEKGFYQECAANSPSMVFQDFVWFRLEESWNSIEYALAFTSFVVHDHDNKLIPICSFDWSLAAKCVRDSFNNWTLEYSNASSIHEIAKSFQLYDLDKPEIAFSELGKLKATVGEWLLQNGL